MGKFVVTLPGAGAREREDVAVRLARTRHLQWGQREREDALLFRVPAADVRAPDRARDVVDEFVAALPGEGLVRVNTSGMSQEDVCKVSLVLRECRNASGGVTSDAPQYVPDLLEALRAAWDTRHRVPAADADVHEVLYFASVQRAKDRARQVRKAAEAAQAERVKANRRLQAELAARVTARAGLAEEEEAAAS
jgi:hypothetical protein